MSRYGRNDARGGASDGGFQDVRGGFGSQDSRGGFESHSSGGFGRDAGGFGRSRGDGSMLPGADRVRQTRVSKPREPTPEEIAAKEAAEAKRREEEAAKAAAEKAERDRKLIRPPQNDVKEAIVDGGVVLKIARHVQSHSPDLVTGQLLGVEIDGALHITDCFAMPSRHDNSHGNNPENKMPVKVYQEQMLECLKQVNKDMNVVGWYSSTTSASFANTHMIENLYQLQRTPTINQSAVLVFDPLKASQGTNGFKALRLTPKFVSEYEAHREHFSVDANVAMDEIFTELPVRVRTATLLGTLMKDLQAEGKVEDTHDILDLSASRFAQASLDFLSGIADDFQNEQSRLQQHVHSLQRQKASQAVWRQKREAENAERRARGEEPLTLDGVEDGNSAFKPLVAPKRMDALVMSHQVDSTVQELNTQVTNSMVRLELLKSVN